MGKYYRTSSPRTMDYMYQVPDQLALAVIASKDRQVDEVLMRNEAMRQPISETMLEADKFYDIRDLPAAKERLKYYDAKIDEVSEQIRQNPENLFDAQNKISKLRNEFTTDISSGELANYMQNKKQIDLWTNQMLDSGYDKKYVSQVRAAVLDEWGGTDWEGERKQVGSFLPAELYDTDPEAVAKEIAKGMRMKNLPSQEKFANEIYNELRGDGSVQASMDQRLRYGLMDNIEIEDHVLSDEDTKKMELARLAEKMANIYYKPYKAPKTEKETVIAESKTQAIDELPITSMSQISQGIAGIPSDTRVMPSGRYVSGGADDIYKYDEQLANTSMAYNDALYTYLQRIDPNLSAGEANKMIESFDFTPLENAGLTPDELANVKATVFDLKMEREIYDNMRYRLQESDRQRVFENAGNKSQINIKSGWNMQGETERMTDSEIKSAQTELGKRLDDYSTWDRLPVVSANPDWNGKSIRQLIDDGTISYKVEKEYVEEDRDKLLGLIGGLQKNWRIKSEGEGKNKRYYAESVDEPGMYATDTKGKLTEDKSKAFMLPATPPDVNYGGFDATTIMTKNAMPTGTPINGRPAIRIPVKQKDENFAIFVPIGKQNSPDSPSMGVASDIIPVDITSFYVQGILNKIKAEDLSTTEPIKINNEMKIYKDKSGQIRLEYDKLNKPVENFESIVNIISAYLEAELSDAFE